MSILSRLTALARNISISNANVEGIKTSLSYLYRQIDSDLLNVTSKFVFGSYQRGTSLDRTYDSKSDVDLMVVFGDGNSVSPQTLLDRVKRMVNLRYTASKIKQSSPTIRLELNHIIFEITPARTNWFAGCEIPAPAASRSNWISTNPDTDQSQIAAAQQRTAYNAKHAVKLVKYWNVLAGRPLNSYEIERSIAANFFYRTSNIQDTFFDACLSVSDYSNNQLHAGKIRRMKNTIRAVKSDLNSGHITQAEDMLFKLFNQ